MDRHQTVKRDQKTLIGRDKHTHVKGEHREKIEGDASHQVDGQRSETVGTVYVLDAGQEIHIKSGTKVIIECGLQLSAIGAGGFVNIGPDGVTIQGALVLINSGGSPGVGSGSNPNDPELPSTEVVTGMAVAVLGARTPLSAGLPLTSAGTTSGVQTGASPTQPPRIIGNPTRAAGFFPGRQSNKDTCALMSTQGIVQQATGVSYTESQMQTIGHASGAYTACRGTTNESAIMSQAGIPATQRPSPTLNDIAASIGQDHAVIVALDARYLWGAVSPTPLGHAVRVTGVEEDPNGTITALYINDTGTGRSNQRVSATTFLRALNGFGGGRMAVSNEPVP
jgi:hypothetical protein